MNRPIFATLLLLAFFSTLSLLILTGEPRQAWYWMEDHLFFVFLMAGAGGLLAAEVLDTIKMKEEKRARDKRDGELVYKKDETRWD